MKNKLLFTILLMLFCPARKAGSQEPEKENVNEKYAVESVEISGVSESKIGKALNADLQKLVGEKYNQEASDDLAKRLRKELREYSVKVKVKRGDKADHVKLIFEAERIRWKRFEVPIPPAVYHSKEGFSGAIEIPIDFQHNVFTFGLVDSADELLERNAGFRLRYENRKVGTDLLQLRVDFDSYHQMWNQATEAALAQNPDVPGVYRTRQDFAPSLSLMPVRDLKLSVGTSFERFQTQYPVTHTQTAYAGTANVQFRHDVEGSSGVRQRLKAAYGLRTATRVLDSDFVYTRHLFTADYTISKGKNLFGAHFRGGLVTGQAPLFERFSMGDSFTLRGWDKFDVAPVGGARAAHGSLEYRYRPFQIFYDVGTVWDPGQSAHVRHGLGFGLVFKGGAFISLAFPVRLNHVVPALMLGCRY
ncbi:MAG TPA: BamA/TamA family outer membrane protein [Acidobacteriota bacterium]|nr:BamA/TamA family outer membrane protein [Acidobacteriota bacterium]